MVPAPNETEDSLWYKSDLCVQAATREGFLALESAVIGMELVSLHLVKGNAEDKESCCCSYPSKELRVLFWFGQSG